MVNRNAVRHLALVVGVLLCFFVYMGYRLKGKSEAVPEAASRLELAGLTAEAPVAQGKANSSSLMTMRDSPITNSPQPIRPPINTPTSPASVRTASEAAPDIASILQAERETSAMTPPAGRISPPASPLANPAAPSGSVEESGAITGLIPAPPIDAPSIPLSAPASDASMPVLAFRDSSAPASPNMPPPPSAPLSPPAPTAPVAPGTGSALKPPSSPTPSPQSVVAAPVAAPPASSVSGPISLPAPPLGGDANSSSARRNASVVATPPTPAAPTATRPSPAPTADSSVRAPSGVVAGGSALSGPGTRPLAAPPAPAASNREPPVPPAAPGRGSLDNGPAPSDSLRIYVIRPGDTLSRIAARELGSISLADNIFLLNRDVIADPDHLMVGDRIRLPVRESLPPAATSARPATGAGTLAVAAAPRQPRLHRVAPGETLSSIALRYYGSSSGWRFLYEANTKTIPNPNQLTVGTELVIPPYGEKQ